jgi:hypothetical protein
MGTVEKLIIYERALKIQRKQRKESRKNGMKKRRKIQSYSNRFFLRRLLNSV